MISVAVICVAALVLVGAGVPPVLFMVVCLLDAQLLTKEPVEPGSPETYGDFDYQVNTTLTSSALFSSFPPRIMFILTHFSSIRPEMDT